MLNAKIETPECKEEQPMDSQINNAPSRIPKFALRRKPKSSSKLAGMHRPRLSNMRCSSQAMKEECEKKWENMMNQALSINDEIEQLQKDEEHKMPVEIYNVMEQLEKGDQPVFQKKSTMKIVSSAFIEQEKRSQFVSQVKEYKKDMGSFLQ